MCRRCRSLERSLLRQEVLRDQAAIDPEKNAVVIRCRGDSTCDRCNLQIGRQSHAKPRGIENVVDVTADA
jgi:hypothetical protein